jgi:spoIIIJ-associated protein
MVESVQTIEASGSNVEAAIAAGLDRLRVGRDAVEVEVLDEGSRGVFGLGGRQARVRLMVKPRPLKPAAPAEPAAPPVTEPAAPAAAEEGEAGIAREVLAELLARMGVERAQVALRYTEPAAPDEEPRLVLDIEGPDVSVLIGRRGETLAALQFITQLIVGQRLAKRMRLAIDVEGFRARREGSLRRLAERMAEQAVRTHRTVTLEPMPPHERRIIHLCLRDHPQVTTESVGEGERRKVTIIPKR